MGDVMNIGKIYWYLQRYSALYFLVFLIYTEYLFWSSQITFNFITENILFKISLSFFILLACAHAFIGLWTVGTDYLTKRALGFVSKPIGNSANVIRKIYEVVFISLGLFIIYIYFSIIWS
jgi:succinate dehydrogenase / fumarate reductase membrane anchor subunit